MAVLIVVGLGWRSGHLPFPGFLVKYGGDALWAWLVFLGLSAVFPRRRTLPLAVGALAVAATVEFLQLHHGPWLEVARSTRLGCLALGSTFNPPDLVAYAVGIAVGAAVDLCGLSFGSRLRRRPDRGVVRRAC
jgi:hypothetical protein